LGHGRNLLKLQRNEEAEETLRIAHNIAASNGFFPAAIHISGLLASALARLGESKLAVKITDNTNLHSRVIRCGGLQYFYFYAGRAEALFRDHQQEKAIAAIDTALSHASRIRDHGLLMQGYGLKADFLLAHSHDDPEGLLCRKRQEDLAAKYGLVV